MRNCTLQSDFVFVFMSVFQHHSLKTVLWATQLTVLFQHLENIPPIASPLYLFPIHTVIVI